MPCNPHIVCEISANHLGSLDRALELVDAAAAAGAHAVKVQTWTASRMVGNPDYIIPDGPWQGRSAASLYREAQLPWEWHGVIFDRARSLGMEPFASVFDTEALAFLETLDCPRYKIASFELIDLPLIRAVARTGKPMVMSTGMATVGEIANAVAAAKQAPQVTLLKCTSTYPAPAADCNLASIQALRDIFGLPVGLSDHTEGIAVPLVAVALGATMIEKHLTLSRADGGPDAAFSLEPEEFAAMVKACATVSEAIGSPTFGALPSEAPSLALRRSLWTRLPIPAGGQVTRLNVVSARPAGGMDPGLLDWVCGRRVSSAIPAGVPLTLGMLAG
jgi:N-acetylneuraminate synthase